MLSFTLSWIQSWLVEQSERGQGLVEYALILILVAALCFIILFTLGNAIRDGLYDNIINNI